MIVSTTLVVGTGAGAQTVSANGLISVSAALSSSIDGGEVAVDTLSAIVLDVTGGPSWAQLPHGTEIAYMEGSDLIGRFYLSSCYRVAKEQYEIKAVSAMGLLEEIPHAGGIYPRSGAATAAQVLAEIIGGTFTFTVDNSAAGWRVGGWLPYDTARANLHRLLLALGINMLRGADGSISFGLLDSVSAVTVDDDDVYMGGEVGQGQPATSAAVTEHQYLRLPAERETLYDSSDGSAGDAAVLAVFDGPYYDLQASGSLTVLASGDNFARVQGVGILTGIPYTHTERIVRLEAETDSQAAREISVADDGLINPYNSARVAKRLLDYHSSARTIQGRLRLQPGSGIRPGKCLALTDAFGEPARAMLARMDITASATVAASIRAVVGYQGGQSGNTYTDRQLIDESGTVTLGAGHYRIILVGGGQGGQGGYNGEPGAGGLIVPPYPEPDRPMKYAEETLRRLYYYAQPYASGGAGGEGGAGGAPGNILVLDLDLTGEEELTVSLGAGGSAGAANGGTGGAGGHTTVTVGGTVYSTANGAPSSLGLWDPLGSGGTLAAPGSPGMAGAAGGLSTVTNAQGYDGGDGGPGGDLQTFHGGDGGEGAEHAMSDPNLTYSGYAGGGGGGGAAAGADGEDGGDAAYTNVSGGALPDHVFTGGDGGDGADASAPSGGAAYGCGGAGGNGGGGGGNAGGADVQAQPPVSQQTPDWTRFGLAPGNPGAGGSGSVGGAGGGGCVIILWDAEGRTTVPTRLGPVVVESRQTVEAQTTGGSSARAETVGAVTASAEAETMAAALSAGKTEIRFGAAASATFLRTMQPVPTPDCVHSTVYAEARTAAGAALTPYALPAAAEASGEARAGSARILSGTDSAAHTGAQLGTGTAGTANASAALPPVAVEASASAGRVSGVQAKGGSLSSVLASVAASLWGRWAWVENGVLYIDREFGGASQAGGLLAVD